MRRSLIISAAILLASLGVAYPAGQKVSPIEVGSCSSGQFITGYTSAGLKVCGTPLFANPTATAGPTAINGSASTAMRSDAAPAIQIGSSSQKGLLQVDGTTILESGGIISGATTTLNAGSSTGLTAPGAMTPGSTYSIGSTSDKLQFGSLGLGIASPATNGQIATQGGANGLTLLSLKRNTDSAPTGKFVDHLSAAGASLYTIDITGTVTVGTWQGTKIGLAYGGTNADLSATGGTSQVLKQVSSGAAVTVGQLSNTDISGLGTAATVNTGTSGATLGFLNGNKTDSGDNSFTGQNTFASVLGSMGNGGTPVTASTYSFQSSDCGKTVVFNRSGDVTGTIPASIVPATGLCNIGVLTMTNFKVYVNGTAVTAATLLSENSYTGTRPVAGSFSGVSLMTVSSTAYAVFVGSGS